MDRVLRSVTDYRTTLMRNQLTSLVLYEVVTTTSVRAKELVAFANRFFHRVKSADANAKRYANQVLFDKNAALKVFEEILPRFDNVTTYVGSLKVAPRRGDNASQIAVMLLAKPKISAKTTEAKKSAEKASKTPKTKPAAVNKAARGKKA